MVTAETALLLPGLVAVLALLLGVLGQGLDQVRATDAARSAARLLARGEPEWQVRQQVLAESPGSTVTVARRSGLVTVTVVSSGRSLLPGVALPDVRAEVSVAVEPGAWWLA